MKIEELNSNEKYEITPTRDAFKSYLVIRHKEYNTTIRLTMARLETTTINELEVMLQPIKKIF